MNILVRVPDAVAARLAEAGADPEGLAVAALMQAANALAAAADTGAERRTPAAAAARMRAARAGTVLPQGMTIRDLMTHGRA